MSSKLYRPSCRQPTSNSHVDVQFQWSSRQVCNQQLDARHQINERWYASKGTCEQVCKMRCCDGLAVKTQDWFSYTQYCRLCCSECCRILAAMQYISSAVSSLITVNPSGLAVSVCNCSTSSSERLILRTSFVDACITEGSTLKDHCWRCLLTDVSKAAREYKFSEIIHAAINPNDSQ